MNSELAPAVQRLSSIGQSEATSLEIASGYLSGLEAKAVLEEALEDALEEEEKEGDFQGFSTSGVPGGTEREHQVKIIRIPRYV